MTKISHEWTLMDVVVPWYKNIVEVDQAKTQRQV